MSGSGTRDPEEVDKSAEKKEQDQRFSTQRKNQVDAARQSNEDPPAGLSKPKINDATSTAKVLNEPLNSAIPETKNQLFNAKPLDLSADSQPADLGNQKSQPRPKNLPAEPQDSKASSPSPKSDPKSHSKDDPSTASSERKKGEKEPVEPDDEPAETPGSQAKDRMSAIKDALKVAPSTSRNLPPYDPLPLPSSPPQRGWEQNTPAEGDQGEVSQGYKDQESSGQQGNMAQALSSDSSAQVAPAPMLQGRPSTGDDSLKHDNPSEQAPSRSTGGGTQAGQLGGSTSVEKGTEESSSVVQASGKFPAQDPSELPHQPIPDTNGADEHPPVHHGPRSTSDESAASPTGEVHGSSSAILLDNKGFENSWANLGKEIMRPFQHKTLEDESQDKADETQPIAQPQTFHIPDIESTQAASSGLLPDLITVAGHAIIPHPSGSGVIIDDKTPLPNGPVQTVSGKAISIDSSHQFYIGQDSYSQPTTQSTLNAPTDPAQPSRLTLPNGFSAIPLAQGGIAIGSSTIKPGQRVTMDGTPVFLDHSNNLVFNPSTATPPGEMETHGSNSGPMTTIGSHIVQPVSEGALISGTTLSEGGPALTVAGTPISYAHETLVVGTSSVALSVQTSTPVQTGSSSDTTASGLDGSSTDAVSNDAVSDDGSTPSDIASGASPCPSNVSGVLGLLNGLAMLSGVYSLFR